MVLHSTFMYICHRFYWDPLFIYLFTSVLNLQSFTQDVSYGSRLLNLVYSIFSVPRSRFISPIHSQIPKSVLFSLPLMSSKVFTTDFYINFLDSLYSCKCFDRVILILVMRLLSSLGDGPIIHRVNDRLEPFPPDLALWPLGEPLVFLIDTYSWNKRETETSDDKRTKNQGTGHYLISIGTKSQSQC